jgi:DNA repair protein RadC
MHTTNTYSIPDTDIILNNHPGLERKYVLKIRDLPTNEKPREKLLALGPSSLSAQELLAVVLSTGTKKEDVLHMSGRVLNEYGELILSRQTNALQMSADLNIPINKAVQIVACAELGKRFFQKDPLSSVVLRNAKDVYKYLADMRSLPKEHMRGIYLNTHYRVIHDEVISIGTINSSLIHPREVFKPAIEHGAAAVILAHNHPSGVAKASDADKEITRQLVQAGKIIGIHLIDHIIVALDTFISIEAEYN